MWPPAYIYVAPSLHLCGPQPTFMWPPAYIYVAPSLHLCGPQPTFMWPQPTFMWPLAYIYVAPAYIYVAPSLHLCGPQRQKTKTIFHMYTWIRVRGYLSNVLFIHICYKTVTIGTLLCNDL